jgi:hypothetical protein
MKLIQDQKDQVHLDEELYLQYYLLSLEIFQFLFQVN